MGEPANGLTFIAESEMNNSKAVRSDIALFGDVC
jgi:hypothetical protein